MAPEWLPVCVSGEFTNSSFVIIINNSKHWLIILDHCFVDGYPASMILCFEKQIQICLVFVCNNTIQRMIIEWNAFPHQMTDKY